VWSGVPVRLRRKILFSSKKKKRSDRQTGTDQAHERKDPATGRTYDTVYSIYGSIRVRLQHSEHTRAMVSHGLINWTQWGCWCSSVVAQVEL
jgi:hypothetical protein